MRSDSSATAKTVSQCILLMLRFSLFFVVLVAAWVVAFVTESLRFFLHLVVSVVVVFIVVGLSLILW